MKTNHSCHLRDRSWHTTAGMGGNGLSAWRLSCHKGPTCRGLVRYAKKKSGWVSVFVCRSHVTILSAIPSVPILWPWQKYQTWLRFYQTISNLSLYHRGSFRMGRNVFSSIPTYIKDISFNVNEFKRLLKKFFVRIRFVLWRSISNVIIRSIFYS